MGLTFLTSQGNAAVPLASWLNRSLASSNTIEGQSEMCGLPAVEGSTLSFFSLAHLLSEDLHSLKISQAEVWRPPRWSYGKSPPCDPTYILCGQADGSLASEWPLRTLTSSVPCLSLAGQQHQIGLFFAKLQIQNCILCSELWFTKEWFNKVIRYFRRVTTKM